VDVCYRGPPEEKELISESQAEFRKGRNMIDNIFVLNHLMQRQEGKNDKMYMLFADLKAAFDNVGRKILWEELRSREEENLVRRMEKIYGQTEVMIRTNQGYTEGFKDGFRCETGLCDESTPF